MIKPLKRLFARAVATGMLLSGTASAADPVDYSRHVLPILETYCVGCHSEGDAQGGLALDDFESLVQGGDSGAVITPGTADSSRMLLMIAGQLQPEMPPDGAEGPDEDELATLAAWIEQGAAGPDGSDPPRRSLRVPSIPTTTSESALPITALAFGPDSSRFVARFRKVEQLGAGGQLIRRFPDQPGKVYSLRFSPDGKRLLVGTGVAGLYGRAAVYDIADGSLVNEMIGHDDIVQDAIFSPHGSLVATASYDHSIILWDADSGSPLRKLDGHNGAVFSLAFSPDSQLLVSGSADETVKVWQVADGGRLDTMSQPEGEVYAVAITGDGQHVLSGSADNRVRAWRLVSKTEQRINPLVASLYADESPLTHIAMTPDAARAVVVSEAGNVKVLSTQRWNLVASLDRLPETVTDLAISDDSATVMLSMADGRIAGRTLPPPDASRGDDDRSATALPEPIYMDLGPLAELDEAELRSAQQLGANTGQEAPISLPRGAEVSGVIASAGEDDWFALQARAGEMWVVETDTAGLDSRLDSVIEIRDADGHSITQARLQAVRDSYFTFRGKNSTQTGDFRVFAWQEMNLGEYFYSGGEVTRLWLYPRGPDSGFEVFPGIGNRWTYFGTSGTAHALGDPAYIVRPLERGEPPQANGLPVFEIPYLNDDEPTQTRGKDSYLLFHTPATAKYLLRVRDARGEGGAAYRYRLRVRPAAPGLAPSVRPINKPLPRGGGRELMVLVDRSDGFDGEVRFEIDPLPEGLSSNFPITIQAGQRFALGTIYASPDAPDWDGQLEPSITAHATVLGRYVRRPAGTAGKLTLADRGPATLAVYPDDGDEDAPPLGADAVVRIRPGETISLVVRADRQDDFTNEIPLGKEQAGRNLPFGSYVDNIGLNGLLIRENEDRRRFFITADPVTELGRRQFFLKAEIDGGITSAPLTLQVFDPAR